MALLGLLPLLIIIVVVVIAFMRRPARARAAALNEGLIASWALAIPRGHRDTYSRAERLRDDLRDRFRAALPAGLVMTSYESARGSGDVWMRLEFIQPDAKLPELSLRAVIAVTVDRFDFHHFEHVLRLEVGRGTVKKTVEGLTALSDTDIAALLAYAAGTGGSFPRLQSSRTRQLGWQLWRPANRISRLRRDWPALALLYIGLLLILIGLVALDTNSGFGFLSLLSGAGLLAGRLVMLRRRLTLILNTGKPTEDPRTLVRMDSWQVTLTGLGERQTAVLRAILAELEQHRPPGVTLRTERIGYPSVDSKVEREQQVASFRRAIAFLRLESYGRDLYVGWDSHVNGGVWMEQDIGRGLDRETGNPVVARRVVQGWQTPTEYDISDTNFLTEWLHACVVNVVKQQLAEYRVDQEIDFTIQRESRNDALRSKEPGAAAKPARFGAGLFKRTA